MLPLAATHGDKAKREDLSGYYLAGEVAATYHGMTIAVPDAEWATHFALLNPAELARILKVLAANVRPDRFRKNTRGAKKPAPKRVYDKKHPHVSTARIIAKCQQQKVTQCQLERLGYRHLTPPLFSKTVPDTFSGSDVVDVVVLLVAGRIARNAHVGRAGRGCIGDISDVPFAGSTPAHWPVKCNAQTRRQEPLSNLLSRLTGTRLAVPPVRRHRWLRISFAAPQ
jgi:hypothetical protein